MGFEKVVEVFDEYIVQVGSGRLVRLPELGSRLSVGESGPNILPPTVSDSFGPDDFDSSGNAKDTVIAVKHNTYAITWLALNQLAAESEKRPRPKRFWHGEDLGQLTLVRMPSDLEMRAGDRVRLKDTTNMPVTFHGNASDPTGVVQVQQFVVKETMSTVEILWQDGTRETLKSTEVIPYLNPDEYDCWPGDHVVWKNEGETRPAIVQSVNAVDRTAMILFPDTGKIELASLLELDPHGNSDVNAATGHEEFGVRHGDFVFIHSTGTTNGMEPPKVPRIGEIEPWVREPPFVDGDFAGWRKELHDIGVEVAAQRGVSYVNEKPIKQPAKGNSQLYWCGEVTALHLDGTVEVTHPDFSVASYPLTRLTRLYDGLEQLQDEGWDDDGEEGDMEDGAETWAMDEDGKWQPEDGDDEWEDVSSTGAVADLVDILDEDSMDEDELMEGLPSHPDLEDELQMAPGTENPWNLGPDLMQVQPAIPPSSTLPPDEDMTAATPTQQSRNDETARDEDEPMIGESSSSAHAGLDWNRFEILPSAPVDHAFYSSPHAQPPKSFLARLRREYRALESSLPESIVVRAFEDRTDLLRSLIVGPANTPYEDAPFVIDWMLDSNFPNSPPIAHFLSWTNGNGRVNPNLYEEGKVCLSILGTWTGDKTEVWSPARSSILQALVSIQGLVLVKEPWFCEPAYDKLRGTEEGTVNSRLYSEKAYVLSRGFVRRALEIPLGGLESEISKIYYKKGYLRKVIEDSQNLIQKSRSSAPLKEEDQDLAVPRLTTGGIITLERTLIRLQGLLDKSSQ
ncbi:hypothetical protein NLJ89_g9755 [Agrocybe chaxingu]|uniref:UBC core domain-containing protein n=1 Tax=Agrocybe chaxingu TaxID=84603 RepID=A0A9W8JVB3_9AGAR|nr:hypothetical protein NLJ89_g9755 [Agrocybe chaxingu]